MEKNEENNVNEKIISSDNIKNPEKVDNILKKVKDINIDIKNKWITNYDHITTFIQNETKQLKAVTSSMSKIYYDSQTEEGSIIRIFFKNIRISLNDKVNSIEQNIQMKQNAIKTAIEPMERPKQQFINISKILKENIKENKEYLVPGAVFIVGIPSLLFMSRTKAISCGLFAGTCTHISNLIMSSQEDILKKEQKLRQDLLDFKINKK